MRIDNLSDLQKFLDDNNYVYLLNNQIMFQVFMGELSQNVVNYDVVFDYCCSLYGVDFLIYNLTKKNWLLIRNKDKFIELLASHLEKVVSKSYWFWETDAVYTNIFIRLVNKAYNADISNIICEIGVVNFANTIVHNEKLSLNSLITKALITRFNFATNPKTHMKKQTMLPLSDELIKHLEIGELPNNTKLLCWLLENESINLPKDKKDILYSKLEYCFMRKNVNFDNLQEKNLTDDDQERLKKVLFIKGLKRE